MPAQVRAPRPCHLRARPGVVVLRSDLAVRTTRIRGLLCVSVECALLDTMRLSADLREAVVAVDMTVAAGLTTPGRVHQEVASGRWSGVPGVPQVRAALSLASPHSASPPETLLRLVWKLDAGLPDPLVNQPVYDRAGRLLGYPDLLDPEAGLVAEYDGLEHRSAQRHSADVDREARLREHGLEVTRVTARDLRRGPALVRRLLGARRRARFEPAEQRSWVVG